MREYLGHHIPESLEEVLSHGRVGVVVVDMQNDFIHPDGYCAQASGRLLPGFPAVVEPIGRLLTVARASGAACFFSRVIQRPDGSLASSVWLMDLVRYGMEPLHCMEGTWGQKVIDELPTLPGDVVFDKPRRSAFHGTALETALRTRGVSVLIVVGVAATGCVESTVRDAIERDFLVVVPLDGVSDGAPELTENAVAAFQSLLDTERVTDTERLCRLLGSLENR